MHKVIYQNTVTPVSTASSAMHFILIRNDDGTVTFNKNAGVDHLTIKYRAQKSDEEIAAEASVIIESFKDGMENSNSFTKLFHMLFHGIKLDKKIGQIFDEELLE